MSSPTLKTLTEAIDASTKVANSPLFLSVVDRLLGFKISEWSAQGDVIKKHIMDGYEEAKQKGLGIQYVSAFRENTNLINISTKAARYIEKSTTDETSFENDFFWNLLDHSKKISNEEVQDLISRIIAGEYNKPGTYSMSTLQVIKSIGKTELELFEKVGALLIDDGMIPKDLFTGRDNVKEVMREMKLDFREFQILQGLGLILPNDMSQEIDNKRQSGFEIRYFDENIIFEADRENDKLNKIKLPDFYGLSVPGKQIMKNLKPKKSHKYSNWIKENYKINGYTLKNLT